MRSPAESPVAANETESPCVQFAETSAAAPRASGESPYANVAETAEADCASVAENDTALVVADVVVMSATGRAGATDDEAASVAPSSYSSTTGPAMNAPSPETLRWRRLFTLSYSIASPSFTHGMKSSTGVPLCVA